MTEPLPLDELERRERELIERWLQRDQLPTDQRRDLAGALGSVRRAIHRRRQP